LCARVGGATPVAGMPARGLLAHPIRWKGCKRFPQGLEQSYATELDLTVYTSTISGDQRRSAARELRKAGVPESTIMDIGGWKTREMFKRYAITDSKDIAAAIAKRERAQAENSHDFSHDSPTDTPAEVESTVGVIN